MKLNFKSPFILKGLVLFIATQFFGVYLAQKILTETNSIPVESISTFSIPSLIYLVVTIFLFLFFSFKFPKFGAILFRIFLTFVIFSMLQLVLSLWFNEIITFFSSILVVLLFWMYPSVILQNLVMIISIAGIGSVFGISLTPITVVLILVVFSFYDIIAVYKTGHMVKMAEAMIKSRAIFGFVIPRSMSDLGQNMKGVEIGERFMILGSGDIALPLVLSASLVRVSLAQSLIVVVFSVFGYLLTSLIFANQKVRRPMAALPPIAALSILGYLISSLIIR